MYPTGQPLNQLLHLEVYAGSFDWHALLPALQQAALQDPQSVLTAAVRGVLDHAPGHLDWHLVPGEATASFEAVHQDTGCLYSINILDGTVLVDGRPPSRLPQEVTGHPMFRYVEGAGTPTLNIVAVAACHAMLSCQPQLMHRLKPYTCQHCNPSSLCVLAVINAGKSLAPTSTLRSGSWRGSGGLSAQFRSGALIKQEKTKPHSFASATMTSLSLAQVRMDPPDRPCDRRVWAF
jgi:hypothetical protein